MKKDSFENNHQKDVNLREAVARRACRCPQKPAGLDERVMARMESESRHASEIRHTIITPPIRKPCLYAAACVAAAVLIGYTLYNNEAGIPSSSGENIACAVPQQQKVKADSVVSDIKEENPEFLLGKEVAEVSVQPSLQESVAALPDVPEEKSVAATSGLLACTPAETHPVENVPPVQTEECSSEEECVVNAAVAPEEEALYKNPGLIDELIAKFAAYHDVKQVELDISVPLDSNTAIALYVFPDKSEIEVFGRLLKMAIGYDKTSPGYHLDLSSHLLIFELLDEEKGLQYRWMAERIEGRVLLCCTHSLVDTEVMMDQYYNYRNKCILHSLNTGYYQL
ncbi:MAG: hypothetical protein IKD25_00215 [Bacteroidaceae bacterium]|nr:hypothetical protein [Bacteroidaceae bacterium]